MPATPQEGGSGPGAVTAGDTLQANAGGTAAQSIAASVPAAPYLNGAGYAQSATGSQNIGADSTRPYAELGQEQYLQSCFKAGTPIQTARGAKLAQQITRGDRLWSRSEFEPDGRLELKAVEAVFVRVAPILNLHVDGRVIGTTAEHPFFVMGCGWEPCKSLQLGDQVRLEGGWGKVEGVADSGEVTTVYNWRIADFHTYFVGGDDWGWKLWAHNVQFYGHIAHRFNNYALNVNTVKAEIEAKVPEEFREGVVDALELQTQLPESYPTYISEGVRHTRSVSVIFGGFDPEDEAPLAPKQFESGQTQSADKIAQVEAVQASAARIGHELPVNKTADRLGDGSAKAGHGEKAALEEADVLATAPYPMCQDCKDYAAQLSKEPDRTIFVAEYINPGRTPNVRIFANGVEHQVTIGENGAVTYTPGQESGSEPQ